MNRMGAWVAAALALFLSVTTTSHLTACYQSSPVLDDGSYQLTCPLEGTVYWLDPDGREAGPWGAAIDPGTFVLSS